MKQPRHKSKVIFPGNVAMFCRVISFFGVCFCATLSFSQITPLPEIKDWNARSKTVYSEQVARATPEELNSFMSETRGWLKANIQAGGVSRKEWNEVFDLYRWAKIKQTVQANPEIDRQIEPADWNVLITNPDLALDFLGELSTDDRPDEALLILVSIMKADQKEFDEFPALASAFALVWDSPRTNAYHFQVKAEVIPKNDLSVPQRFHLLAEASKKNQLKNDLSKLRTDELVFIVDSQLPASEWKWIHQKVRVNKSTLGEVYFSIVYDQNRLNQMKLDWPYPSYRLQDIKDKGGICVDQAYYAVEVARSYGIPSLYFEGTGRRGGHAWFGYLRGASGWDMDVGRFTYDNFTTGYSIHPQTRQQISDHELELMGRSIRKQAPYLKSDKLLQVAQLYLEDPSDINQAVNFLDQAIDTERRNDEAWKLKAVILEYSQGQEDVYEKHLRSMIAQFVSSSDLQFETQMKLIELLEKTGKSPEANILRKSIIRRQSGARHDMSLKLINDQLAAKLRKKDEAGALKEFEKAVGQFKRESGSVLDLMSGFVSDCLEAGQNDAAFKAMEVVKKNIVFDQLTQKYFDDFQKQVHLVISKKAE